MNKKFCRLAYFFIFFFLSITGWSCTSSAQRYLIAPTVLPHTTKEMKTAGFWINQHPFPDRLILSQEDVRAFNAHVQNDLKLTQDLKQFPRQYPGSALKKILEETWGNFSKGGCSKKP